MYASENECEDNDLISSAIPNSISQEDNVNLTRMPSDLEIKDAVFDMNGDGAPGPLGGCFYQSFWEIIGPYVCKVVSQFFAQGWMLPNLNANVVVLIPKFKGADRIEDFRPIALANFQFKIITKVLADRLALVAPMIFSTQQRGFVRERHIQECIRTASEVINMPDHKVFWGNLALKLDIKKVFDTLDWSFIIKVLESFGFCSKFCSWIKIILS